MTMFVGTIPQRVPHPCVFCKGGWRCCLCYWICHVVLCVINPHAQASPCPALRKQLFSPMTSFTQCPGTSFTLPRVRSRHGGGKKDGLEDDGSSGAEGPVCSGGQAEGATFSRAVCRVRDLAAYGIPVAEALRRVGCARDCGTESAAALQSPAHRHQTGTARGPGALALSRLGGRASCESF